MASPLAKGLFQNVIACSGTAFLDWAVTSNENSIKHALIIAQRVNCYTPGPNPPTLAEKQVIYECMATVDDSDLVANLTDFRVSLTVATGYLCFMLLVATIVVTSVVELFKASLLDYRDTCTL